MQRWQIFIFTPLKLYLIMHELDIHDFVFLNYCFAVSLQTDFHISWIMKNKEEIIRIKNFPTQEIDFIFHILEFWILRC